MLRFYFAPANEARRFLGLYEKREVETSLAPRDDAGTNSA
ncbi:hypothetical protein HMPREF1139_0012 [Campylobacter sp. FOBRC14]|nr:hypothetical protein HMPREF1139_0012 [Campylobacter sp. FOBRC14]